MKKTLIILSIIILCILVGFGLFYFLGNGKEKVANFFSDNTFGSFFDVQTQSKNDFLEVPLDVPEETPEQTNTSYVAPILRQISFEPISGYTYYSTTTISTRPAIGTEGQELFESFVATSTAIRFQERATGHMYDVFEFIQLPQKISNITEQKIYSAQFSSNKDQFIYQIPVFNNEQIKTTFARLVFSTTTGVSIEKNDISSSVSDFVLQKNTNKLIYSVKQEGISGIYISNIDRTNEKLVKTLPFNEFLLDPVNSNETLITTKASWNIPGYAYLLNTTTGAFSKILGNINGLVVKVSPNKKYYIYSQSGQTRPSVKLYSPTTGNTKILSIDTIPSEKCVFSQKKPNEAYCFGSLIYKAAQYPDDWYKGKVFNYESLVKIDLENGSVKTVYNFQADKLNFDAQNIQLTPDDSFIIFENKYDLTLWSLNLAKLSNELN